MDITQAILLTTQRSGSTFIRLWLNSHPDVRCHSEVFHHNYDAADGFKHYCESQKFRRWVYHIFGPKKKTNNRYIIALNILVKRFLNELYFNPNFSVPWTDMRDPSWKNYQHRQGSPSETVVAFQLMYRQISNYKILQEWILRKEVSILHLIRRNALKILISRIKSRQTKNYQFNKKTSKNKIYLDPSVIISQLDKITRSQEINRKTFNKNPYLEISYEDFFSDHHKEYNKILNFFNLRTAEMKFPGFLKKLNPDSLSRLIKNYDEVASALKGTPHEKFLG